MEDVSEILEQIRTGLSQSETGLWVYSGNPKEEPVLLKLGEIHLNQTDHCYWRPR